MGSLGPLCSQAFAAGQYKRVSAWLQVATLWPVLLFGPGLAAAWMYSGTVMELAGAGSSPRVAALADEFGQYSLLWLAPAIVFNGLSVWLESMDIVWPTTVLSVVFVGVNLALNWVFVGGMGGMLSSWTGLGLVGSPVATAAGKLLQLLALWAWAFVFGRSHRPHRAWQGWSWAAMDVRFVALFLRLGASSALAEAVFDWSFEILTAFGGMLIARDTATMGVLVALFFLFQSVQTGLLSSVGLNVGRRLAQGDAESAARMARIGTLWSICSAVASAGVLAVLSPWVGLPFTADGAVRDAVASAVPVVALTVGVASASSASLGVLDGQKRSDLVTYATLGSTWMIGLPMAWVLGEAVEMGVAGLWWGFLTGECVRSSLLLIMATRTVWEDEVTRMEIVMEDEDEDDELVEIALGGAGLEDIGCDDGMGDFADPAQRLARIPGGYADPAQQLARIPSGFADQQLELPGDADFA
jgi:MATE family multidrug resistance protein